MSASRTSRVRQAGSGTGACAARPEPRPRKGRTPYAPPHWSSRLYLRMATADIGLFRFLLEAHGHLGFMSVADKHAAILKLSYSPDQEREVRAFLEEAGECLKIELVGNF